MPQARGLLLTALHPQTRERHNRWPGKWQRVRGVLQGHLSPQAFLPHPPPTSPPTCRANPVWLDPFCRNLELAAQAEHEDDLPENLSEIADLWNSPTRTHVSLGLGQGQGVDGHEDGEEVGLSVPLPRGWAPGSGALPCVRACVRACVCVCVCTHARV